MPDFRFENLTVYQLATDLSHDLLDIADRIEVKKKYRFAQQLDGATLSITNNIAEGSGAVSDKDFVRFLDMARKSLFECANLLLIFERRNLVETEERRSLYPRLLDLSIRLNNLRKSLVK